MMQAHPRMAMPPENRFVLRSYFEREEYGDLRVAANRRRMARRIVKSDHFGDLGLDPKLITARIVDEAYTVGSAFGLVLRAYADRFGKVRWGDKRPAYRHSIWVIQRLFPDAQFIHLVRDGRDCVASMERMPPWNSRTTGRRIEAWMEAVERWADAVEVQPPGTLFELRYEDLVSDPEPELRKLCEFLGEEFDSRMLHPEQVAGEIVPERETWHANTYSGISASSIGNFEAGLSPEDLALCEGVMGERLQHYGYQLTGAPAPSAEQLEDFRHNYEGKRRWVAARDRADRAQVELMPVADMSLGEFDLALTIKGLERRIASLEAENRTLDKERARLDKRVRAMESSHSWRLTAPIRRVKKPRG